MSLKVFLHETLQLNVKSSTEITLILVLLQLGSGFTTLNSKPFKDIMLCEIIMEVSAMNTKNKTGLIFFITWYNFT